MLREIEIVVTLFLLEDFLNKWLNIATVTDVLLLIEVKLVNH